MDFAKSNYPGERFNHSVDVTFTDDTIMRRSEAELNYYITQ